MNFAVRWVVRAGTDRDSMVSIGLLRESLRGRRKFGRAGAEPPSWGVIPRVPRVNFVGCRTLPHKVGGVPRRAADDRIEGGAVA